MKVIIGFLIIRFTINYTSKSFRCMTKEVTLYLFNCMYKVFLECAYLFDFSFVLVQMCKNFRLIFVVLSPDDTT